LGTGALKDAFVHLRRLYKLRQMTEAYSLVQRTCFDAPFGCNGIDDDCRSRDS
jgi:hypothetical protein